MDLDLPLYKTYTKMSQEVHPFNRIHRLIDTFEEFSKFLTIISIRDFLEVRPKNDLESKEIINFLINRIYTPTLGTWHEFLYRSAKYISCLSEEINIFSGEIVKLLGYKHDTNAKIEYQCIYKEKIVEIYNIQQAFGLFTEMRNDYAHGATKGDEICEKDYHTFLPLLDLLIEHAEFLNDYTLYNLEADGIKKPTLKKDSQSLILYPLILSNEGEFYYFCDAKFKHKEKLTFLNYSTAKRVIDHTSYLHLKRLLPGIDWWENKTDLKKQRLLDHVIGRYEEAKQIEEIILKGKLPRIIYVFGDPGIGKSTMAAYLNEYFFKSCIKVFHMFIYNEALSLKAEKIYQSLTQPLITEGLIPALELNTRNLTEIKRKIDVLLQQASEAVGKKNKKIVILIDGLDEAYNYSEHIYNILPSTPPPHVYIIYFSRRKEEIYVNIYKNLNDWVVTKELKPLNRQAIRAILWQGISKYSIDDAIINKVTHVSQGNPLYLKYLVNALLDGQLVLTTETLLPRDIIEYYNQLILKVVKKNPQLPIIEIAMVFAACNEPLHQEKIKEILKHISISDILLGLNALSELFRSKFDKNNKQKYFLYHKSIADFLKAQYEETARKIEETVLFSVEVKRSDNLNKWFKRFLNSKSLLKIQDEKNLSLLIERSQTFTSAYQVLVKIIAHHINVNEILERCFELISKHENQRIFCLIHDCLLKIEQISTEKYFQLISHLYLRFPGDENLISHFIDALFLLRFPEERSQEIAEWIMTDLLNYSILKIKNKRFRYIKIINIISGFSRFSDTFEYLKHIYRLLLNIQPEKFEKKENFDKIEKLLSQLARIVFHPSLNRLVEKIREKDNQSAFIRGNESYRRIFFKIIYMMLKTPQAWFDAFHVGLLLTGVLFKNGLKITTGLINRIGLLLEIVHRSFPLIFTDAESPVINPMGMGMIAQTEELFRKRFKMIKIHDTNVYEYMKKCSRDKNCKIGKNIAYVVSLIALPVFKVLWNYSSVGLESLADYDLTKREQFRQSLHLLKKEENVSNLDEQILFEYLSINDAWKNYFAKASIIIHGNTDFDIGKSIILRMLEENSSGKPRERLRLYRQYFAIHSYLLRRTMDSSLRERIKESLEDCLNRLLSEITDNPEMMICFANGTLYNQGDPFNPILPMGIYQGIIGMSKTGENQLESTLKKFIQLADNSPSELRSKLLDKLLNELLSLSLFYPGLALKTCLKFFEVFQDDPQIYEILKEKASHIDILRPGYFEAVGNDLNIELEKIKNELLPYKLDFHKNFEKVEKISNEIRIFAWHECITTIMVNYPRIRDLLIETLDESFKTRINVPLLVQEIINNFFQKYFSGEIREELRRFFLPDGKNN